MKSPLRFAAASLMLAGAPFVAQAYTFNECNGSPQKWGSSPVAIRSHSTGFPAGSPWLASLQSAVDAWNLNPSNVRLALSATNGPVFPGNFTSEVYFSSDDGMLDGASALAFVHTNCLSGGIYEVDIVVDSRRAWTTSTSKSTQNNYGGASRFLTTTLGHELGHALGLAHTNDTYNVMGQSKHVHTNGGHARFYSGEDAAHGLVALYGVRSSGQDLGVVHWRRTGTDGEYSAHGRTRVFSGADGTELTGITLGREPYYTVRVGQLVYVEFTFENNGVSRQTSSDVEFVLSTNDTISTGDAHLANRTLDLGRNTVTTTSTLVRIPSGLSLTAECPESTYQGCHWLGAIIDADGSLTEVNETNNATYVGIRVVP